MSKGVLVLSEIGLHGAAVGSSVYILTEQKEILAEIDDNVVYVDAETLRDLPLFNACKVMDSFKASGRRVVLV